jgi:serpin B
MLGEWQHPFAERATSDEKFFEAAGEHSVRMMRQRSRFRYAQVQGAKLIELPYHGGLAMVVVLPDAIDGLGEIEDEISRAYKTWIGELDERDVDLKLPRFTAKTALDLRAPLKAMGIRKAFQGDADFSGMTGSPDLYIGQAIQKAWIETSEKGSEAAAVTVIEMFWKKGHAGPPPPPPVVFHADHPFMYLIRDVKTDEILFIGRVVKPT